MQGGLGLVMRYYIIIDGSLTDVKVANFLNRGTETEEQVQKRLRNAKEELKQGQSPGLFDHILVNDDLETCYKSLKVILVTRAAFIPTFLLLCYN